MCLTASATLRTKAQQTQSKILFYLFLDTGGNFDSNKFNSANVSHVEPPHHAAPIDAEPCIVPRDRYSNCSILIQNWLVGRAAGPCLLGIYHISGAFKNYLLLAKVNVTLWLGALISLARQEIIYIILNMLETR